MLSRHKYLLLNILHITISIIKFPEVIYGKGDEISKAVSLSIGRSKIPKYSRSNSEKSFTI